MCAAPAKIELGDICQNPSGGLAGEASAGQVGAHVHLAPGQLGRHQEVEGRGPACSGLGLFPAMGRGQEWAGLSSWGSNISRGMQERNKACLE